MTKKAQPPAWYDDIVKQRTPKRPFVQNSAIAFVGGGLLCALAESASFLLQEYGIATEEIANLVVMLAVVALAALATGIGCYDMLAQRLGAGVAVPISGFANSVAAAMLEHRSEGFVLGSGCNSFKLAGAVIVSGTVAAFIMALLLLLIGKVPPVAAG